MASRVIIVISLLLSTQCYGSVLNCSHFVESNKLMSRSMRGFWRTLDEMEQIAVITRVGLFWRARPTTLSQIQKTDVVEFVKLFNFMTVGGFRIEPESDYGSWLKSFFSELKNEPYTFESVKELISGLDQKFNS